MSIYRICRMCGRPVSGRVDKKFCDDHCRSNFNNKVRSRAAAEIRLVNSILRHNRRVLNSMVMDDDETYALRSSMDERGFNFNFYTQQQTLDDGNIVMLCYDYAWRPIDEIRVKVMRWRTELTEAF